MEEDYLKVLSRSQMLDLDDATHKNEEVTPMTKTLVLHRVQRSTVGTNLGPTATWPGSKSSRYHPLAIQPPEGF